MKWWICIGNFLKICIFYVNLAAKPKNFVVFAFIYVSGSHVMFYEDFGMNSYGVDSYEAMKWWSKAMKRLIASIFKEH
jgi:hypothetical protein